MPEEMEDGFILVYGRGETEEARERGYLPDVDEYRATFATFHEAHMYAETIPVPTTIVYDEETDSWEVYVDYGDGE